MAPHWYELGIQLLNEGQESRLDSIKSDNGSDSKKCCIQMFWYWLESHPEATWQDLLESLRSPALELHNTAATIEAKIGKYILKQNYGNAGICFNGISLSSISIDAGKSYLIQKHLWYKKVCPSKVESFLEMNA